MCTVYKSIQYIFSDDGERTYAGCSVSQTGPSVGGFVVGSGDSEGRRGAQTKRKKTEPECSDAASSNCLRDAMVRSAGP